MTRAADSASPTPRTDAEAFEADNMGCQFIVVKASFAGTIERELAEAREFIKILARRGGHTQAQVDAARLWLAKGAK